MRRDDKAVDTKTSQTNSTTCCYSLLVDQTAGKVDEMFPLDKKAELQSKASFHRIEVTVQLLSTNHVLPF